MDYQELLDEASDISRELSSQSNIRTQYTVAIFLGRIIENSLESAVQGTPSNNGSSNDSEVEPEDIDAVYEVLRSRVGEVVDKLSELESEIEHIKEAANLEGQTLETASQQGEAEEKNEERKTEEKEEEEKKAEATDGAENQEDEQSQTQKETEKELQKEDEKNDEEESDDEPVTSDHVEYSDEELRDEFDQNDPDVDYEDILDKNVDPAKDAIEEKDLTVDQLDTMLRLENNRDSRVTLTEWLEEKIEDKKAAQAGGDILEIGA